MTTSLLTLRSINVGDVYRGRSLTFTLARILAFSGGPLGEVGWPHRNLHTDRQAARAAGLPDIIASGTQFEGLMLSHLLGLFGMSWHSGGELEAKVIKSAFINDTITPVAVIESIEREKEAATVVLDIWCENQNGEKVLVGKAKGRIGDSSRSA